MASPVPSAAPSPGGQSPASPPEPFPSLDDAPPVSPAHSPAVDATISTSNTVDASITTADPDNRRSRSSTITSTLRQMAQAFEESDIPPGFMAATGTIAASAAGAAAPMTRRRSSLTDGGSTRSRRASLTRSMSGGDRMSAVRRMSSTVPTPGASVSPLPGVAEHPRPSVDVTLNPDNVEILVVPDERPAATSEQNLGAPVEADGSDRELSNKNLITRSDTAAFDNGYHFPPSYSAWESIKHGSLVLWRYTLTPVGFLVVVYGLNVVAWGGMLFLLLCNAAPAMCHPSCNDINSPRRKWMEVDQQIVNALFCVTGFGFAPWRTRDLWYLAQFRLGHRYIGLRRLAGINRSWFRLAGSQQLPIDIGPETITQSFASLDAQAVPYPPESIARAPLTGERAEATALWKMDFLVCMNFLNTVFQALLAGFMWGMNRYDRPSWVTGFLVSMGIVSAILGGLTIFLEGKRVKSIEGVPLTERDLERLQRDKELGISHYNNLGDKKPKISGEKK
ncbi:hypothetical protein TD95_005451 [Thielaviopsis punctulata]|uniref:Uncharacterized protein n=1 Tax=Thielaviopsis punctulata TaxID=72032 RepID=A0A0F4Z8A3_9PEZI|nr:hypothetical protein TD95_005451 [Thielaviopsis punctulata]